MTEKDREDPERSIPSPDEGPVRSGGTSSEEGEAAGDRAPSGEDEEAADDVSPSGEERETGEGRPSGEGEETSDVGESREGEDDDAAAAAGAPESRRERRRRRRNIIVGVLIAFLTLLLTGTAHQLVTLPDVRALADTNPETTAFIERYKELRRAEGREPDVRWRWVPYDQISPHLKRAVVVGEDIEFFSHEGFSVSEIKAALDRFLRGEAGLRGASTITQQLAKNLWLSPSRNPLRKLKEGLLTRQLEKHLSKGRILEIYLNVVEFGPGVYGAEAAARRYFGKSANALGELEAAQLAAALPRSTWHPGIESSRYRWYVNEILGRMAGADFLWRRVGGDVVLPPPVERDTAPTDSALLDSLPLIIIPAETVATDTGVPPVLPSDTAAGDTLPESG